MPFQNPDPTYGDQANRVYRFYQLVCDVRDKHSDNEVDTRRVGLNNVAMAANASTATLRLLDSARRDGGAFLIGALGLSRPEFINPVAEDLLRASRNHLLIESQFQLETSFRNILHALGKTPSQGFYSVASEVLDATGLGCDTRLRTLNVPALMRNCMHANGIHHGYKGSSTVEVIDGIEFRFDHNKRVQCGSWFHIVTALTASVAIVDDLFATKEVSSINLIADEYAHQRLADVS